MLWHSDVTEGIIKAYYSVYNELGYGFAESVYHKSMLEELRILGFNAKTEQPIDVFYKGLCVGHFFADIVVNDRVIVELKSVKELATEHFAQLINYLKASRYEVGLLMNFGPEAKYERKVYANRRKGSLDWVSAPPPNPVPPT
jgi:GxxExxY protein